MDRRPRRGTARGPPMNYGAPPGAMSYNGTGGFGSGGQSFSSARGRGGGPPMGAGAPSRGIFSGTRGGGRGGYGGGSGGNDDFVDNVGQRGGGFAGGQGGSAFDKPQTGGFKSGGFDSNASGGGGGGFGSSGGGGQNFGRQNEGGQSGGGSRGGYGGGGYGGGQQEQNNQSYGHRSSAGYGAPPRSDGGGYGSNDQNGGGGGYGGGNRGGYGGGGRGGYDNRENGGGYGNRDGDYGGGRGGGGGFRGGRGGGQEGGGRGGYSGGRDDFGSGNFSNNDSSGGGGSFGSSRGGGFDGNRSFDGGASRGGGRGGSFNSGGGGYRNQNDENNSFNSGGGGYRGGRGGGSFGEDRGGYRGGRGGGGGGSNFGERSFGDRDDFSSGGGGGRGGYRGGGRGGFRGGSDDSFGGGRGGRGGRGGGSSFDGGRGGASGGGGYSRGFGDEDDSSRGGGGGRPFGNDGGYGGGTLEFTRSRPQETNADGEPLERAPRGWMPEEAEVEDMYRSDRDNISKFEEDDQSEAQVKVDGGPDMSVGSWENAGLHDHLRHVLVDKCGFTKPRPIQAAAVPHCLNGNDVIAQAVTGSGKTLAFVLPILNQILNNPVSHQEKKRAPQAIVLEPTRELAMQVDGEFRKMANGTDVRTMLAFGQMDTRNLISKLDAGIDVYVGTVGRLMGFMENGEISLHRLRYFVLDEADRLLNRADMEQLNKILHHNEFKKTTGQRQNMLFSATMPDACKQMAAAFIKKEHVTIRNVGGTRANHRVTQVYEETPNKLEKNKKLKEIFNADTERNEKVKTLIFVETKKQTDFLAFEMMNMGIEAHSINGDRPQNTRTEIFKKFLRGDVTVLVGTDVCARGLDVPNLERVVNYDLPGTKMEGMEAGIDRFIHRIGRTGRTHKGTAITFVDPNRDFLFAKELVKICSDVGQVPPDFLRECSENGGSSFGGSSSFGASSGGGGGSFGASGGFGNAGSGAFGTGSAAGSGGFGTGSGGGFGGGGFGNNTSGGFGSGGFGGEKKADDVTSSGTFGENGFGSSGFGGEKKTDDATSGGFGGEKKADDVSSGFGSSGFGTSGFGSSGFGDESKKSNEEEPAKEETTAPAFGSSGFGPASDSFAPSTSGETSGDAKKPAEKESDW